MIIERLFMSYVSSLFASKNNPTKKGSDENVAGASEGSFFYGEKKYKRNKQNNIEKREKHLQLF